MKWFLNFLTKIRSTTKKAKQCKDLTKDAKYCVSYN